MRVAGNFDFDGPFDDLEGNQITFRGLEILQVEFDAEGLVAADTVTLSLYRKETRTTEELVARYSGTSDITGAWKSIQSNQLIQYFDGEKQNEIYGRVTNATGNSAACTFHVVITARPVI